MESKLLALRRVVDELSGVYGVVAVVLYGSHARGDFDEGSDIDLFVLFKSKDAMLKGYRGVVRILSRSDLFIQANLRGLDELRECDPYFLQTVFAEGKL
ncbi:TPA: nucleotidyltransferase domain-containing protein, partial [Candidatus Bathyarchaeota archaeon]|nr:nucleotidyltransferase domain-containing protein [Candidatus Bathyarchaeota archaeon]